MTTNDYFIQEEQSHTFFLEIKNELKLTSTDKVAKLVRAVLTRLRKGLSHEQVSLVLKNLPSVLQLLFIVNWKYEKTDSPVRHLDELAGFVYQVDQQETDSLFTSEADALNTVSIVLDKLHQYYGILGLNVFQNLLTQDSKETAFEG